MIRLAAEIDKFYQFSQLNYYETLARKHVVEQVQEHVRQTLPKHTLEVFGSERTGLAMATSDIDLRLMANEPLKNPALSTRHVPRNQRHAAIHKLRTLYWKNLHKHKAYLLPQLQYARYPLISLQDRQSGLDVQIVLVNDSFRQRQLVKEYMEQYPYLRQLFYVVKTIFDVRGLNDVFRGGFGSYTVFMMVVASIRHKPHPRNDAAGGLINFLKFYRDFDYTEKGLSIEPARQFPKGEDHVMTRKAKPKLKVPRMRISSITTLTNTYIGRTTQTPSTVHARSSRPRRRNPRSWLQSHSHKTRSDNIQSSCPPT
jgi:non-canonical poly(A) RNA polymerase PAPD5/7